MSEGQEDGHRKHRTKRNLKLGGLNMITDTFDNKSEEIIKVCRSDSAIKVDACILTFSHLILKYVLETIQCKKNWRFIFF